MMGIRLYIIVLLCLLLAVGFESTLPPTINNNVIPDLDKLAHFCVFGFMAYLIAILMVKIKLQIPLWCLGFVSLILVTLLGMGNEWIQSFRPGRMVGMDDVLADMLGGLIWLTVWAMTRMRLKIDRLT
ncbi:MAG: VanZ family protein [Mariprofundaceae bacterium]|nr:VanZ family protein [Mariprofundaceae bacterium]